MQVAKFAADDVSEAERIRRETGKEIFPVVLLMILVPLLGLFLAQIFTHLFIFRIALHI